jgi:hypothetical protein
MPSSSLALFWPSEPGELRSSPPSRAESESQYCRALPAMPGLALFHPSTQRSRAGDPGSLCLRPPNASSATLLLFKGFAVKPLSPSSTPARKDRVPGTPVCFARALPTRALQLTRFLIFQGPLCFPFDSTEVGRRATRNDANRLCPDGKSPRERLTVFPPAIPLVQILLHPVVASSME